jgi:hypothetical protein
LYMIDTVNIDLDTFGCETGETSTIVGGDLNEVEVASFGNIIINNLNITEKPFTYTQTVANTIWGPIPHNFNRELTSARAIDTGGNEWEVTIVPIDSNNCNIDVGPFAYAGKVTIF